MFIQWRFSLKQKGNDNGEAESEVTVYDYFVNHRNIELRYSADLPCINVGKPKRPTYFPLEVNLNIVVHLSFIWVRCSNFYLSICYNFILQLCSLVSLQRYTKSLSTLQRASLVEKSRQKPQERMSVLSHVGATILMITFISCHRSFMKMLWLAIELVFSFLMQALKVSNYDAEPLLRSCGISISSSFTQINGRVLQAPKVIFWFKCLSPVSHALLLILLNFHAYHWELEFFRQNLWSFEQKSNSYNCLF